MNEELEILLKKLDELAARWKVINGWGVCPSRCAHELETIIKEERDRIVYEYGGTLPF